MPACVTVGVAPPNHVTQLEDVFVILDGKVLFLFVISFTILCPNPNPKLQKLLQHIDFMHLIIIVVILCDKKGSING